MELKSPAARLYPLQVIAQMIQLDKERDRLAALQVPAAFTGRVPDTPEAQAARRQAAIAAGRVQN